MVRGTGAKTRTHVISLVNCLEIKVCLIIDVRRKYLRIKQLKGFIIIIIIDLFKVGIHINSYKIKANSSLLSNKVKLFKKKKKYNTEYLATDLYNIYNVSNIYNVFFFIFTHSASNFYPLKNPT